MSTVSGSLENWEAQEEKENVLSGHWVHSAPAASVQGPHFPEGAMESEGPPGLLLWPLLKVCHMKGPREKEENHRYTTHLSLGSSKP